MLAVAARDAFDTEVSSLDAIAKRMRMDFAVGLGLHSRHAWVSLLLGRIVTANLQRLVSTMEPVDPADVELFISLGRRIAETAALVQHVIDMNLSTRWLDRKLLAYMTAWRDQVDDIAETLTLGADQAVKDEFAKAIAKVKADTVELSSPQDWRRVLANL